MKPRADLSPFDQGKLAGAGQAAGSAPNPFPAGSTEHRNFELGRRFGADNADERQSYRQARPDASAPDADEVDD